MGLKDYLSVVKEPLDLGIVKVSNCFYRPPSAYPLFLRSVCCPASTRVCPSLLRTSNTYSITCGRTSTTPPSRRASSATDSRPTSRRKFAQRARRCGTPVRVSSTFMSLCLAFAHSIGFFCCSNGTALVAIHSDGCTGDPRHYRQARARHQRTQHHAQEDESGVVGAGGAGPRGKTRGGGGRRKCRWSTCRFILPRCLGC